MAIILQSSLFSWKSVEESDEIVRLRRVLEILPDEKLMLILEEERKGRRDDYPVRALWNCLIAGIVFGHPTISALIRELNRNAELREVCGLGLVRKIVKRNGQEQRQRLAPPDYVFSRFFQKLIRHQDLLEGIFRALLDRIADLLPDFGKTLAVDSKAIPVFGSKPADADMGIKSYEGSADLTSWIGYKLHLMVDAKHELPIGFHLTKASEADSPHLMPLVKELRENHPKLYERAQEISGDKGYDDGKDKQTLYEDHEITPLIPPRNLWSQGEPIRPLNPKIHDTVHYGHDGKLYCKIAPFESDAAKVFAPMQYMGFEKDRSVHKFRCPAAAYGIECQNRESCKCSPRVRDGKWGRTVRVPLDRDRRIFGPVLFDTREFKKLYNRRTSVERVNSRLDNIFGLEHTYFRGLKKIRLRVTLILAVMQAVAVSWIEMGKPRNLRRILPAA